MIDPKRYLERYSGFYALSDAIDAAYHNADKYAVGSDGWHEYMDLARALHEMARGKQSA